MGRPTRKPSDTQYLNVMYADNGKTAGENDAALGDIVAALQPRDMGASNRESDSTPMAQTEWHTASPSGTRKYTSTWARSDR